MTAQKTSQKVATHEEVAEKRKKLQESGILLQTYFDMDLSPRAKAMIAVVQDRLEFRTLQYESQLLDEKISLFEEAISIARKDKHG